jgi:hypothetical protein
VKITLESTSKLVLVKFAKAQAFSHVWQGETDSGIPVFALVAMGGVAPERQTEFDASLQEQSIPRADVAAIPSTVSL